VVDDEPRILDSIRDLLEESFEVVTSTDAREAL
jgi:DNA-binding response OmpR family regulator